MKPLIVMLGQDQEASHIKETFVSVSVLKQDIEALPRRHLGWKLLTREVF